MKSNFANALMETNHAEGKRRLIVKIAIVIYVSVVKIGISWSVCLVTTRKIPWHAAKIWMHSPEVAARIQTSRWKIEEVSSL
jgi:hypothetical protein